MSEGSSERKNADLQLHSRPRPRPQPRQDHRHQRGAGPGAQCGHPQLPLQLVDEH